MDNQFCHHVNTEVSGYTNRPGWKVWCCDCRRFLEMFDPALDFYFHDTRAMFYQPNGPRTHPRQPEQPPMPDLLADFKAQNLPAKSVAVEQLALELF